MEQPRAEAAALVARIEQRQHELENRITIGFYGSNNRSSRDYNSVGGGANASEEEDDTVVKSFRISSRTDGLKHLVWDRLAAVATVPATTTTTRTTNRISGPSIPSSSSSSLSEQGEDEGEERDNIVQQQQQQQRSVDNDNGDEDEVVFLGAIRWLDFQILQLSQDEIQALRMALDIASVARISCGSNATDAARTTSSLQSLSFSVTNPDFIRPLLQQVPFSSSNNRLSSYGPTLQQQPFRHHPLYSLLELSIRGSSLIDLHCEWIGECLLRQPGCQLKSLTLSYNYIGPAGVHALVDAIRADGATIQHSIRSINLQCNRIGGLEGCRAIADLLSIEYNSSASTYSSSYADIRTHHNNGVAHRGTRILNNNTNNSSNYYDDEFIGSRTLLYYDDEYIGLRTLVLSNNHIDDVGVCLIAQALSKNRTLTSLHLDSNLITDKGCVSLAQALRCNNVGGSHGGGSLKRRNHHHHNNNNPSGGGNRTLQCLALEGNVGICGTGIAKMIQALKYNPTLINVGLECNSHNDSDTASNNNKRKQHHTNIMFYTVRNMYFNSQCRKAYEFMLSSKAVMSTTATMTAIHSELQNASEINSAAAAAKSATTNKDGSVPQQQCIALGLVPNVLSLVQYQPTLMYQLLRSKPEIYAQGGRRRKRRRIRQLSATLLNKKWWLWNHTNKRLFRKGGQ